MNLKYKKSGKVFLISLIFTIIICLLIAAVLGTQIKTKRSILFEMYAKNNEIANYSIKQLVIHEIFNKPLNKRWSYGWRIFENQYIFTDNDGTKYTINTEEIAKLKSDTL